MRVAAIHDLIDPRVQRPQQNFADAQVIDQFSAVIHDVDEVERFAVATMFAHEIEHLLHRPVFVDRHKVRRHQTADAAFRITEQLGRDFAFPRREQLNELPCRRARHFLEQPGAIVRRHFIEHSHALLVRHRAQKLLLVLDAEILENVRRQRGRQDAEDDHLLVLRHVENYFGDIDRRPIGKNFPERIEIARFDQRMNFRE